MTIISVMMTLSIALTIASPPALAVTMPAVKHAPSYQYVTAAPGQTSGHILLKADYGGDINDYAKAFTLLAATEWEVRVEGPCYSACTIVLHNPFACALPNAVFGFHTAKYYNRTTLEVGDESSVGNQIMWSHYPPRVRERLGGKLSADMVYIKGTDLIRACPVR